MTVFGFVSRFVEHGMDFDEHEAKMEFIEAMTDDVSEWVNENHDGEVTVKTAPMVNNGEE